MINEKAPSRLLTWDSFEQRFTFGFGSYGAKSLLVIMLIMSKVNLIKFSNSFMPRIFDLVNFLNSMTMIENPARLKSVEITRFYKSLLSPFYRLVCRKTLEQTAADSTAVR